MASRSVNKARKLHASMMTSGRDRIAEAEASIETVRPFSSDRDALVYEFEETCLKVFNNFPIKHWQNSYDNKNRT